ncbi:MAG: TRAP transporter small permease subunit [Firmicutes bacterium]|jgi:TRAP-type C4-dicarboxylate transport system permease small subunit|nr:TRAP transporter small permease subunit [Bacillota bacterium]
MTALKKIWNFLLTIEKTIMIVASIGVVLLIFISVIMRYILEKNFPGMEELVVMVAFWIYFMGGTYGSYENSHITADILSVFVKNEKAQTVIKFIREIITMVILFAASYCAVELMAYTAQAGAVSAVLKVSMMIVYAPIFVGIFMMNFYSVAHVVEYGLVLLGKKRLEVEA